MGSIGDILSHRDAEDVHAHLNDLARNDYAQRHPQTPIH